MTLRRLPILPTLVVLAAVALMVRLGLWQLERLHRKEALIAHYAAQRTGAAIAFPARSHDERALFRRAATQCAAPAAPQLEGAGSAGTRFIVRCANGALVQLGTSLDPTVRPAWTGGPVTGTISRMPDRRSWLATLGDQAAVPELLLVADPPLAGLAPNARPDPAALPNNHLSYAVQWFLFAATALAIYALALRKRLAAAGEGG